MCNRTRASHDYRLYVKIAISNCDIYSFFVRIVNVWNYSLNYDMQITFLILFFVFRFFSLYITFYYILDFTFVLFYFGESFI